VTRGGTGEADLLVALNAIGDQQRATLCLLGQQLGRWRRTPTARIAARAAQLGVPQSALARALEVVTDAPRLAAEQRRAAERLGAVVVTLADREYPAALRDLPLPPPALYCRGALPRAPAVAIVGSRRPTEYGRECARWFARELARQGVVVVSGFARGIDGAAHRGALDAGGRTVAVLGCGLDIPYPKRNHAELAAPIAACGALVSELPIGTPPRQESFPLRNRLIAALSRVTLVVEAAVRSGSLITARHALELGREVAALPGRICDETAQGCNALIADGAIPALHPRDLLAALGEGALGEGVPAPAVDVPPPLPGLAARLWERLPPGATRGGDELAAAVEASADATLAALLELELGGWVARLPGPTYARRP
jgi:DNA processing protein